MFSNNFISCHAFVTVHSPHSPVAPWPPSVSSPETATQNTLQNHRHNFAYIINPHMRIFLISGKNTICVINSTCFQPLFISGHILIFLFSPPYYILLKNVSLMIALRIFPIFLILYSTPLSSIT